MERPAKLPWWQVTKTPRQAFVLGLVWLVLGLCQLVLRVASRDPWRWYQVAFVSGFLLLGLTYIASGIGQFRRTRELGGADR